MAKLQVDCPPCLEPTLLTTPPPQTDQEGWKCRLDLKPGLGGDLAFPSHLLHGSHLSSCL